MLDTEEWPQLAEYHTRIVYIWTWILCNWLQWPEQKQSLDEEGHYDKK